MHLLSPLWLIALAPWLGVVVWMLRGTRDSSRVPFLALWKTAEGQPRTQRRMRLPRAAVALVLAAALLGIVGAARPRMSGRAQLNRHVVVVVDRGLSMSARGKTGLRFVEAADRVAAALRKRFGQGQVNAISVPGAAEKMISIDDLERWPRSLSPTACDTAHALNDIVAAQDRAATVVVVTDRHIMAPGDRVIQVTPDDAIEDVGIVRLAVRDVPTTQAMVVVQNQSGKKKTVVAIRSAQAQVEKTIELPPAPETREYFFDLPSVGDEVEAELIGGDGDAGNDQAWAVREANWPKVEVRSAVPSPVEKVIEAYAKARPANAASSPISVVDDIAKLGTGERGVVVDHATEAVRAAVITEDHQVTRNVHWEALKGLERTAATAPQGWRAVVRAGDAALVAVKEGEPRRVWVGFNAGGWDATTDFVVFWTNVLDWLGKGEGAGRFASHPLSEWTAEWKLDGKTPGQWPGVYVRSDGAKRAFNPPDVVEQSNPQQDWQAKISNLEPDHGSPDLTSGLLLAALASLLGASIVWRR